MAVGMGRSVRFSPLRYWAPAFAGEALLWRHCAAAVGAVLDIPCSAAHAVRW